MDVSKAELTTHAQRLVDVYKGMWSPTNVENATFAEIDGCLYIIGTNDPKDWLDNIDCRPGFWPNGTAHSGFCSHAALIAGHVNGRGYDYRVICGHSLGGAVAELLACMWGVPCITWGSPNVWKEATIFPRQILRIYNRADPVVSVPSRLMGWHHAPGTKSIAFGPRWWLAWWRWLRGRGRSIARYHSMKAYRDRCMGDYLDNYSA